MNNRYKLMYSCLFVLLSIIISYKTLSSTKAYSIAFILAFMSGCIIYIYLILFEKRFVLDKYKALFILTILFIPFQSIISFNFFQTENTFENRNFASLPDVFITHEHFPSKMDSYINDRIGLRQFYVNMNKYNVTTKLNFISKVIIGKDNWLFFNDKQDGLEYILGKNNFANNIKYTKMAVQNTYNFCQSHNIKLILFIPPNKSSIYPEYLQDYIIKKTGLGNYHTLKNLLQDFNHILIMPDKEILESKKKYNEPVYYKQDTHWNNAAAYEASKVITEKIQTFFPSYYGIPEKLIHLNTDKVNYNKDNITTGDLYNMLPPAYKPNVVYNKLYNPLYIDYEPNGELDKERKSIIYYNGSNKNGPKILVFHDSFMGNLYPFLEYGASQIAFYWTYNNDISEYKNMILEANPDIIIWERVERMYN